MSFSPLMSRQTGPMAAILAGAMRPNRTVSGRRRGRSTRAGERRPAEKESQESRDREPGAYQERGPRAKEIPPEPEKDRGRKRGESHRSVKDTERTAAERSADEIRDEGPFRSFRQREEERVESEERPDPRGVRAREEREPGIGQCVHDPSERHGLDSSDAIGERSARNSRRGLHAVEESPEERDLPE